ncbi:MAG: thioredoxin family protein [Verrucomicrobiales bacterium]
MIRQLISTIAAAILGAGHLLAGGEVWVQDFEAAKATAAKDKKDLLIDFTGSDWCGWCIKLNEEVFSKDAFRNVVPNDFVLVELDFPQDEAKVAPEIKKQNEGLQKTYAIEGFPTIILADASGRPYAKTGYEEGGPEKYVTHLATLREAKTARDAAFAKAEKAEGLEKAKLLAEGLAKIAPELQGAFYQAEVDAIIAADKEDTLGFGKKAKLASDTKAFEEKVKEVVPQLDEKVQAGDFDGAGQIIDKLIADGKYEGEMKQRAMTLKLQLAGMRKDNVGALKLLDEIVAIAPESDTAKEFAQIRPRIEATIEAAKAQPAEQPAEQPKE